MNGIDLLISSIEHIESGKYAVSNGVRIKPPSQNSQFITPPTQNTQFITPPTQNTHCITPPSEKSPSIESSSQTPHSTTPSNSRLYSKTLKDNPTTIIPTNHSANQEGCFQGIENELPCTSSSEIGNDKLFMFHPYQRSKQQPLFTIPRMPNDAFKLVMTESGLLYHCTYPNCTSTFTRRATNAKSHWLVHADIRPYTCHVCFKSFVRQSNCKRHLSLHSKEDLSTA